METFWHKQGRRDEYTVAVVGTHVLTTSHLVSTERSATASLDFAVAMICFLSKRTIFQAKVAGMAATVRSMQNNVT